MKKLSTVALFIFLGLMPISVPAGDAQTHPQPDAHLTYTLKLVRVVDAPAEWMWMVQAPYNQAVTLDGAVFRSLKSPILRQWVSQLPPGAGIAYTPSSLPLIGKIGPLGDPEAGISDFARFCRSRYVSFGFNPSL